MKDYKIEKLVIKNICSIGVVIHESVIHFGLNDLLNVLALERTDKRIENSLVDIKRFLIPKENGKERRVEFIDEEDITLFFETSEVFNAVLIKKEIDKYIQEKKNNYGGLTSNDLRQTTDFTEFLEERNQDKIKLDVCLSKIEKMESTVKAVVKLYDSTDSLVIFNQLISRIKFTKGLTIQLILEELITAKIFDTDGYPVKHYIDKGYFKVFIVSTQKLTHTKTRKDVFVYQKGVKLIEELFDKKYGVKGDSK